MRERLTPGSGTAVAAIPPPAPAVSAVEAVTPPYRFVFIGTDGLVQNRLCIDFLVQLWARLQPAASLHIYGRQERPAQVTHNVHWHGYVEDLSEVYSTGSILLLPAVLSGGVKTKAIEAWAYGRPVLGNPAAFEGLDIQDYPLRVPESQWHPYLENPDTFESAWTAAARLGNHYVRTTLAAQRYASRWVQVMAAPSGDSQPGMTAEDPSGGHRFEREDSGH